MVNLEAETAVDTRQRQKTKKKGKITHTENLKDELHGSHNNMGEPKRQRVI